MKTHYNPLEKRDEHGKWTSGGRKILTPGQIKGKGFRQMLPPVGSRGNRVLDRHIDSQIQHYQEQGLSAREIRERLAQRARQDDVLANRLREKGFGSLPPGARARSDQVRRALSAGNAVPAVRPAEPSPGRWVFIRSGNQRVTRPKVGDKARMSLGGAGNQVGTVVAVAGLVAAIDSGDDDMRYVVDWRNGRVRTKIPLSEAGPALPRSPVLRPVPNLPDQLPAPPTDDAALTKLRSITRDDLSRGRVESPHQGQQGSVEIITMPDGTQVVHKKYNPGHEDMADADVLAYGISQVIGAGAPPVNKIGPGEITMGYVPGQMGEDWAWEAAGHTEAPHDLEEQQMRSPEGRRIGLLDYLIANPDRHDQNWMVTPDGKPVPIDNSSAWSSPWGTTSDFWDHVPITSKSEYDSTLAGLMALQPEFDRLGHDDWYMDTISRLYRISPIGSHTWDNAPPCPSRCSTSRSPAGCMKSGTSGAGGRTAHPCPARRKARSGTAIRASSRATTRWCRRCRPLTSASR